MLGGSENVRFTIPLGKRKRTDQTQITVRIVFHAKQISHGKTCCSILCIQSSIIHRVGIIRCTAARVGKYHEIIQTF